MNKNKDVLKIIIADVLFVFVAIVSAMNFFEFITIGVSMIIINILFFAAKDEIVDEDSDKKGNKKTKMFYVLAIVLALVGFGHMVLL